MSSADVAGPSPTPPGLSPATPIRQRWRAPVSVAFLLRRSVGAAAAIWGALTIVFLALHLNGDPSATMASPAASAEDIARISRLYGYDQPFLIQYVTFLGNVLTGHFPDSLRYATSPIGLILERFPNTLLLALSGMVLGSFLGLSIGYLAVFGRHWATRQLPMALIVGLQALPPILLGLVLVLIFAIRLRWLPTSGAGTLAHFVLPAFTLGIYVAPAIARVFRASMISLLGADHVRTAQSKGLSRRMVRLRHIAANAMIPVANQIGLQFGAMIGGAVVVETIFSWPGVGQLAVNALMNRDYPVVLATVSFVAVGFAVVNLLVDIVSAILDPRLRQQ